MFSMAAQTQITKRPARVAGVICVERNGQPDHGKAGRSTEG